LGRRAGPPGDARKEGGNTVSTPLAGPARSVFTSLRRVAVLSPYRSARDGRAASCERSPGPGSVSPWPLPPANWTPASPHSAARSSQGPAPPRCDGTGEAYARFRAGRARGRRICGKPGGPWDWRRLLCGFRNSGEHGPTAVHPGEPGKTQRPLATHLGQWESLLAGLRSVKMPEGISVASSLWPRSPPLT
jgi:hypothetical protein